MKEGVRGFGAEKRLVRLIGLIPVFMYHAPLSRTWRSLHEGERGR
jgi:hypothetical protein